MSILSPFPGRNTAPDTYQLTVLLTGADTSAPTVTMGTVAYTGVGDYRISFAEDPGTFMGMTYGLGATTRTALVGHTVTHGLFTAKSGSTAAYIDISFYNASEAAHNLQLLEYMSLTFTFKTTAVTG
jgi:hypothetical protein